MTRKKIRVCRTTFLEPLFYTFLEKWLQIEWLFGLLGLIDAKGIDGEKVLIINQDFFSKGHSE